MNLLKKESLIITLKIDDASQTFFNEKRKQYFPAYANFVDAHITLFHKLPSEKTFVDDSLQNLSKTNIFNMQVVTIKHIENFVAYEITSTTLQAIHKNMQIAFSAYINEKDKKILWPHVTILNKATNYKAFKTYQKLLVDFKPFSITAIGFTTWLYSKKKWYKKAEYLFNK